MCGLWGKALFHGPISESELLHPVRALSHRGPDGYGWYLHQNVALVHTRLSIIDLSGGAQPLQSFNKKLWGIVNGEVYDYKDLRDNLSNQGVSFKTASDSEVLLNLFAATGVKGLSQVTGEFAFIFYDEEKSLLHFGRDPHGIKPLFYDLSQDGIKLASEIKALDSSPVVLNEEYLKRFIARMIIPPETFVKNVLHVLPGRVYTLNLKTKQLSWESFQSLPLTVKKDYTLDESLLNLEETLLDSVRKRLVADVEVGCYLSGGIDSALITAMAVKLGARPKAFTVGFSDRDLDESSRAALIAHHLGIPHSVVMMSSKNFFQALKNSILAFENPVANPHGAAKNLLSEHAAKSVRVVLSGEGSDEWLGGYSYSRLQKLKNFLTKHPHLSPKLVNQYAKRESAVNMNSLDGRSRVYDELVARIFEGKSIAVFKRAMKHPMYHFITHEKLTPLVTSAAQSLKRYLDEEYPGQARSMSSWNLDTWASLRTDLLHYILGNVGDRQEMAHSLEGRTPFLDYTLTKEMARIPEKYLLHGLDEKWALRQVARKYLPQEIWNHHKHPFFAPMKYLYMKEAREGMKTYIDQARAHTPWLHWKNIDRLLEEEKLGAASPHVDTAISMKLILFSTGVLVSELKNTPSGSVRGYSLPQDVRDITPFRKGNQA